MEFHCVSMCMGCIQGVLYYQALSGGNLYNNDTILCSSVVL